MKLRLENLKPADVARAGVALRPRAGVGDWLRTLTTYAQHGQVAGVVDVAVRLDEAMRALFAQPGQIDYDAMRAKLSNPDPKTSPDAAKVVLVLRAARARVRLLTDEGVDAHDLAALAGVDESYVRRLARAGTLDRLSTPRGPISTTSARGFLQARGVVPFAGNGGA